MEGMTEEEKKNFGEWVAQRENEMFEVEMFKGMGKEDDFLFQVLCFMGNASQKMSLAFTLTDLIDNFPKELADEFREIAVKYHDLQDKVRKLRNEQGGR